MEEPVLQAIEEHVLIPERVEEFIQVTERDDVREKQAQVERERKDIERRLRALTAALEKGGQLDTIVDRIAKLEAQLKTLPRLLPVPRLQPKVIEDRLAEWRRLLRQSPTQARAVLQRVLNGRLVFTPDGQGGYTFEAETRFDKLFAGIATPKPSHVKDGDTRGTEHIRPEDTLDGDYGRVLASAGKCMVSPTGVEPVLLP